LATGAAKACSTELRTCGRSGSLVKMMRFRRDAEPAGAGFHGEEGQPGRIAQDQDRLIGV